jgi:hypothetical protein
MKEQIRNNLGKPLYDYRLEDLREWHVVEVRCGGCGRRETIPHRRLHRGRPAYTKLLDLQFKLKCTRCGARQGHAISVRPMDRD